MVDQGNIPIYEIVILGSEGVGKTQLITRYVNNTFEFQHIPTETTAIYQKTINLNEGIPEHAPQFCIVQIVDVFGINSKLFDASQWEDLTKLEQNESTQRKQELEALIQENRPVGPDKAKQGQGYIFVYDIEREDTYMNIYHLAKSLYNREKKAYKTLGYACHSHKLAICNKSDKKEKTELDEAKSDSLLEIACDHKIVSALSDTNIEIAFTELVKLIHEDALLGADIEPLDQALDHISVMLNDSLEKKKSKAWYEYIPFIGCCTGHERKYQKNKKEPENQHYEEFSNNYYLAVPKKRKY